MQLLIMTYNVDMECFGLHVVEENGAHCDHFGAAILDQGDLILFADLSECTQAFGELDQIADISVELEGRFSLQLMQLSYLSADPFHQWVGYDWNRIQHFPQFHAFELIEWLSQTDGSVDRETEASSQCLCVGLHMALQEVFVQLIGEQRLERIETIDTMARMRWVGQQIDSGIDRRFTYVSLVLNTSFARLFVLIICQRILSRN